MSGCIIMNIGLLQGNGLEGDMVPGMQLQRINEIGLSINRITLDIIKKDGGVNDLTIFFCC